MDSDEEEMAQLRQTHGVPIKKAKSEKPMVQKEPSEIDPDSEFQLLSKMMNIEQFGAKPKEVNAAEFLEKTKRQAGPSRDDLVRVGPPRPGPPRPGPPRPGPPRPNTQVGPPRPPSNPQENQEEEEENEEEFNEEEENRKELSNLIEDIYKIPRSHQIILSDESCVRMITALASDPSGSRLVTGSHDAKLRFYDFAGMTQSLRAFRDVQPAEGNPIEAVHFSKSGDRILCATDNSQPILYDRDGHLMNTCVKGDMYLQDPSNTKGHTNAVTNAEWTPGSHVHFASSSLDSTVRIWDVNKMETGQINLIKHRSKQGKKIPVTRFSYEPSGKQLASSTRDGGLHLWPAKGPFSRASATVSAAHPNCEVTGMAFSPEGFLLATRTTDDRLRIWDTRRFVEPVKEFDQLSNTHSTRCTFSPDGRMLITGTCVKKGSGESSTLVFYDTTLLEPFLQLPIAVDDSVIDMMWHPKLHQMFVGMSSGSTHILFDPNLSQKGALLCAHKKAREQLADDFIPMGPVYNPQALPMYADKVDRLPQFERFSRAMRMNHRAAFNPAKNGKPNVVVDEDLRHGKSGKIAKSANKILLKNYIKIQEAANFQDPRTSFLRHKDEAEDQPLFFDANKPILDYTPEPEAPEETEK